MKNSFFSLPTIGAGRGIGAIAQAASRAGAPVRSVGNPEDPAAAVLFAVTNPLLTAALSPVAGGGRFA
jgi:hypothetical protein